MCDIGYKYVDYAASTLKNNIERLVIINGFALTINNVCHADSAIANQFKMTTIEFQDMLLKNRATIAEDNNHIFKNEDDAIATVVMFKLISGGK